MKVHLRICDPCQRRGKVKLATCWCEVVHHYDASIYETFDCCNKHKPNKSMYVIHPFDKVGDS